MRAKKRGIKGEGKGEKETFAPNPMILKKGVCP